MSLFDRLLEKRLGGRPRTPTFEERRAQWLQEAHAKAERGEPTEQSKQNRELGEAIASTYRRPLFPPLRVAIEDRNAELNPLPTPPPPPVNLAGPLVARGSCKAINPETGRQCALLAGHAPKTKHRHGRTEFAFGAAPEQTSFTRRERLDQLASSRGSSPFTTPATGD